MYLPRNRFSFIFNTIFNVYGRAVLLAARRWERLACRITDNYRKITFLHNCIREDLPPRSLRKKPVVNSFECRRITRQFQHRTMRAIISDLHRRNTTFTMAIRHHKEHCHAALTDQHFSLLNHHIRLATDFVNQRATNRFRNRFKRLWAQRERSPLLEKLVHNLSSKVLTRPQLSLLQHDTGYNLMDARALDLIAALEPTLYRIGQGEVGDTIRHRVTGLLMSHRSYQVLTNSEREALTQLKEDNSIMVLPADKGRATVVMDISQYIGKALELLGDTSAYRTVSGDPMLTLKNQVNKLLNTWKRNKRLDERTLARVRPTDMAMARFYGLPKVHKEGVPLRPIVSFRGTPMSQLAKWLSHRISHLVTDSYTTVNSAEEFLDKIRTLRIEDDEMMVSFDVISLFTSIPQDLAIATIKELLGDKGPGHYQDSLRPADIVNLLTLCLKTYFTFQGTVYEQIKGTPMGSPISSVIAEAVLQWLERIAMSQYRPKFWARYVDDTFVIIKRSQKAGFVDLLNAVCADLQFTEEEEHQGKLAFLDVLIHRQPDGTLSTSVYRKPTHTDRILHFNSNHPVAHKISCIRTLFKRVDSHCNTAEARAQEMRHLFRLCRNNGYPMGFIKRHNNRCQLPCSLPNVATPVQTTRITLPYIRNVSEAVARLLAPHGIQVSHRPDRTLRSCIMRPKDPLPTIEKSNVIYKISCANCHSNYVGETSKRVGTRMQEHRLAIRRGEQYSQLLTHMMEYNHVFNFDEVRVISSDSTKSGRLLKEAWYSDSTSINRHIDLRPAYLSMRAWETRAHSRKKGTRIRDLGPFHQEGGAQEERNPWAVFPAPHGSHAHQVSVEALVSINGSPVDDSAVALRRATSPLGDLVDVAPAAGDCALRSACHAVAGPFESSLPPLPPPVAARLVTEAEMTSCDALDDDPPRRDTRRLGASVRRNPAVVNSGCRLEDSAGAEASHPPLRLPAAEPYTPSELRAARTLAIAAGTGAWLGRPGDRTDHWVPDPLPLPLPPFQKGVGNGKGAAQMNPIDGFWDRSPRMERGSTDDASVEELQTVGGNGHNGGGRNSMGAIGGNHQPVVRPKTGKDKGCHIPPDDNYTNTPGTEAHPPPRKSKEKLPQKVQG